MEAGCGVRAGSPTTLNRVDDIDCAVQLVAG
jgi:hypothetical protein